MPHFFTIFLALHYRRKLASTAPFMPKLSWLPKGMHTFCFIYESRLGATHSFSRLALVIMGPAGWGRKRYGKASRSSMGNHPRAYCALLLLDYFDFFSLYKLKHNFTATCCSQVYASVSLQEFALCIYCICLL